jgi:ribose/xylose/arabinose/galactoside ABC-type transport system permease subunit
MSFINTANSHSRSERSFFKLFKANSRGRTLVLALAFVAAFAPFVADFAPFVADFAPFVATLALSFVADSLTLWLRMDQIMPLLHQRVCRV